jgi:acyl-CoA thioesterase
MIDLGAADADDGFAARCAADQAFLGLELAADGTASFALTGGLARHDRRLYGGTAVAAAIALAEHASGRPALWTTVQFVSGATVVGDRIDCRVDVLAAGHRTTQLRVTAHVGDQELFCALGATATPKAGSLSGVFEEPPAVLEPELCEPFRFPLPKSMRGTEMDLERLMDIRVARARDDAPRPVGQLLFWARVPDHRASPAILGFLADMVPMSVVHATGHMGGGTSLDNTLRVGQPAATEWVLLQLDPHLAQGGYGHGTGHLWSPDGALLATASQTASLIVLD